MEFFRNSNIDFLGKKWYFLAFSLVFSVAGVSFHGVLARHSAGRGLPGGTLVYVKFSHPPDDNADSRGHGARGLANAKIQRFGTADEQ